MTKSKALGIGFLIIVPLILLLQYVGFIMIADEAWLETIFIFTFWWIAISVPVYKYNYLRTNKAIVYKVLGIVALLMATIWADSYFHIPDNPLTIFLLIIFWMSVVYLLIPNFIRKYRYPIFTVYAVIMGYFTYVRLFSGGLEPYLEHKKGTALALFIIPIPFIIALWIFEQWKWLRALKADKANAELELLKTQVNPHFFFNTLNNLYSLTVKHSDEAPQVILKLSDMMRYTIYEGKKEIVPLADEVSYLNNYIDLHRIRYHKAVDLQFHHAISAGVTIAPLLFIILLENAFKHGVETLADSAFVRMNLTTRNQEVEFSIENNFDQRGHGHEKGIGLENLRRRLDLIYPQKHKLQIIRNESVFKVVLNIDTA